MPDAHTLITQLGLAPHPEGGWYRETWRAPAPAGQRSAGTSILFLLAQGQSSHWHRVDASEVWIFQGGTPLTLRVSEPGDQGIHEVRTVTLGLDVAAGQQPQWVVQPHQWQAAHAEHGWCLVACVVAPAFEFEGFEMAPAGWQPSSARD